MIWDLYSRSEIESAATSAIDIALASKHVCGADVICGSSESRSFSMRDGDPEAIEYGRSVVMSIRTISSDGRQGVASTNDLSPSVIKETVEWSAANCAGAEPDDHIFLYDSVDNDDRPDLDIFDSSIDAGIPQERRESVCREMTRAAAAKDSRVESVRSASWHDAASARFYASSAGLRKWSMRTLASCGVCVVLSDGQSFEMGADGDGKVYADDLVPEQYALKAVVDTAKMLGASPAPTGRYSLILPPDTAADMIGMIGELFCASDIQKGRSMMKGKIGSSVAGSCLTIVDDARVKRECGSRLYDSEGVPTCRTTLIDRGVASAYLYDLHCAAKDGVKSTGSAIRSSGLVDVCTSNLIVTPGARTPDQILRSTDRGIVIYEMMGLHTVNSISGEYSIGVKGMLVEHGEEIRPVSGITIAGNLLDLMKSITEVGSDFRMISSVGCPTIVAEDISVAGA